MLSPHYCFFKLIKFHFITFMCSLPLISYDVDLFDNLYLTFSLYSSSSAHFYLKYLSVYLCYCHTSSFSQLWFSFQQSYICYSYMNVRVTLRKRVQSPALCFYHIFCHHCTSRACDTPASNWSLNIKKNS